MPIPEKLIRAVAGIVVALSFLPFYLYITELAPQWMVWLCFWGAFLMIPFVAKWSYEARGFLMLFISTLCAFFTAYAARSLAKDSMLAQDLIKQFSNLYLLVGGGVGGSFIAHGLIERERKASMR